MATSGSSNFNQTRNEIILTALQLVGVYGVGRTVSPEDMSFCSTVLNQVVKHLQSYGLHLWTQEDGVLFITKDVSQYTLSSDSTSAKVSLWSDAVITTVGAAEAASQTSITVTSTAGMASSDIIGIVLDDDTIHWTTISSVTDSTTVVIASGLASAAASGNNVYCFTSRIEKPLRIYNMRRVTGIDQGSTSTQSEILLNPLSMEDYAAISDKTIAGYVSHYYYNPDLTTGNLHLWPRPDDPNTYFRFNFMRSIEDFDSANDNPDLPSEWLLTVTWQLAANIAPAFGKPVADVKAMADMYLQQALTFDAEITSVFFGGE